MTDRMLGSALRAGSSFAVAAAALIAVTPAQAQSVEAFYKGKTIDVYSGHSKGGAYSAYARAVTRHIGKQLPGNPRSGLSQ